MKKQILYIGIILSIVLICCQKQQAQVIEQFSEQRIFDDAGLLLDDEEMKIDSLIKDLENKIGPQIAIVIVDTLNGENINEFSLRTAIDMNLGRSRYDDGLLITYSLKDHQIRIEVGYGLEKILKDEIVARITRETMAPKFRDRKYFLGFFNAVVIIKEIIEKNKEYIGQRAY